MQQNTSESHTITPHKQERADSVYCEQSMLSYGDRHLAESKVPVLS